jgi:Rps23 Pro-64 3,4-dihydroxylase Tpa1-like proline 4-hydroxylase
MEQIILYENFFEEELFIEIKECVNKLMYSLDTPFTTSTTSWPELNRQTSTPILRYLLRDTELDIQNKITKIVKQKTGYFGGTVVVHLWPNLSYIPFHIDNHVQAALTIYLNDEWYENWGGYLMFKDDNDNQQIKCIIPKRNLAVLQKNNVKHSVSTINIGADMRMSLQIFLNYEKTML